MYIKKLILFVETIKHLKVKQIYYRLYYFARNRFLRVKYKKKLPNHSFSIFWDTPLLYTNSFFGANTFLFLNIKHTFESQIDWNYPGFGKLWTYNLNYFDFLNQEEIQTQNGIALIENYIQSDQILKDGKEPYPISLRGINWIKFLCKNKISDHKINQNLYSHYQILSQNIEYHLLGNHLLENGFSLLFAAYYFNDEAFYKKASKILTEELTEQVLNDGAHFELSPMYHQILLHRLLDCINLIKNNSWKQNKLLNFLEGKAIQMLSWLQLVTYKNGNIPMVNDSAYHIAPTSHQLFSYAKYLGLLWETGKLSDSGYRKFSNDIFELFVDVGNVGPTYQPGHAHSDTFNFELYVNEKPFIVDTGVSTYEKNEQRQKERSTASHNTVMIGDNEQTEVWGGFRVAKRAKIISCKDTNETVEATHNGYKKINLQHTRKFTISKSQIIIKDTISHKTDKEQIAYFHFHPNINHIHINGNDVILDEAAILMKFDGGIYKIEKEDYNYALGFNKTKKAIKIKAFFETKLTTTINLRQKINA